jgi:hypothetical protein
MSKQKIIKIESCTQCPYCVKVNSKVKIFDRTNISITTHIDEYILKCTKLNQKYDLKYMGYNILKDCPLDDNKINIKISILYILKCLFPNSKKINIAYFKYKY